MFERRLFFHVDWLTIAALVVLCAIGVVMIFRRLVMWIMGRRR